MASLARAPRAHAFSLVPVLTNLIGYSTALAAIPKIIKNLENAESKKPPYSTLQTVFNSLLASEQETAKPQSEKTKTQKACLEKICICIYEAITPNHAHVCLPSLRLKELLHCSLQKV